MKREQFAAITEHREVWSREQETRAMFNDCAMVDGWRWDAARPGWHTWAPAIARSPCVNMQMPTAVGSPGGIATGGASVGIWAHLSPYLENVRTNTLLHV